MKYMVFLNIIFVSLIISGCKEKRVHSFKYEIINNESICALKPKDIFESNKFSMFDTFFRDMNGNPNDKLSENIYKESLVNLADKNNKYIFCFSENSFKSDFLETYIQVELEREKTLRQYEFINYFCLKNKNLMNFEDREKAIKSCQ